MREGGERLVLQRGGLVDGKCRDGGARGYMAGILEDGAEGGEGCWGERDAGDEGVGVGHRESRILLRVERVVGQRLRGEESNEGWEAV